MELIVPAAILAVAILVAALLSRHPHPPAAVTIATGAREELVPPGERLRARANTLDRGPRGLAAHTRAVEAGREKLARRRREQEHALEEISGLSAGQAKER